MSKTDDYKNDLLSNYLLNSIGSVEVYGDTNADQESLKNLDLYERVLYKILEKLDDLSQYKDSQYDSMKKIGEKAEKILADTSDVLFTDRLETAGFEIIKSVPQKS